MKYAVLIAALMFSLQVNASEEPCRQQYMFSPSPRDLLDIVPIPDSDFSTAKEKNYSPGKSKFFTIRSGPTNTMLIYSVKGEGIRISVKEYEHRPLDGKWINEKLVYVEVWFNPHFGAYWIYDVMDKKIIAHELQNDGWTTYQQCQEYRKNRK